MRYQTFTLSEATLTLYLADAAGEPRRDQSVFMGACEEALELPYGYDPIILLPTGSLYPKRFHRRRALEVVVRRLWTLPGATMADFAPGLNTRYVLEILWQDSRHQAWHRRTYYGVTADEWNLKSDGINQFMGDQLFHAERMISAGGVTPYVPPVVDPDPGLSSGTALLADGGSPLLTDENGIPILL